MPRIPLFSADAMTERQRQVYEKIIAGPRHGLVGPLRAALHSPELADHWQRLGELLRFRTSLPPRLSELAILVTARRWNSQVEWYVHAEAARQAGLPDATIDAIRHGRSPQLESDSDVNVYEFVRQLQEYGQADENTYHEVLRELGLVGIVELAALVGYYTMVSMTLNVHEIPLPEGTEEPLRPVPGNSGFETTSPPSCSRLTSLAPAREPDSCQ